jgi:hypothetical protein
LLTAGCAFAKVARKGVNLEHFSILMKPSRELLGVAAVMLRGRDFETQEMHELDVVRSRGAAWHRHRGRDRRGGLVAGRGWRSVCMRDAGGGWGDVAGTYGGMVRRLVGRSAELPLRR